MGTRKQAAADKGQGAAPEKQGLHPRNRHRERYDFGKLLKSCPGLAPFVALNPYGEASIDFANPEAVRALNKALLAHFYGVAHWDVPAHCLCPPIPGRADYLHHLADLLASSNGGVIPAGKAVRVLDIGVGANCIYPLLGRHEYGWRFTGSDIDPAALAAAQEILRANPGLTDGIELRLQRSPGHIFQGLVLPTDSFDLTVCNPPFHASLRDAREGTERKWRNLGKAGTPVLNFGGQGAELWCPGGEAAFVGRMVEESARIPSQCLWFTTLLSKAANLPRVRAALAKAGALDIRIIEMAQGQKRSRIVAWTYLDETQRKEWWNGFFPTAQG
jgi:23S rRNA (adenine1618-N6)-methyltransferase